ncbi:MAG TPA: hypothetical protein VFX07_06470 [Candidatus Udaeobacter sp.]|jgi:hypothetical protein|nr:hypothetical protein [Candidatus Udaeobacter sp.]
MKKLVSRISKELENANYCGVYEPELSRYWPNNGNARENEFASFAELHGLVLRLLQGRVLRNFR